MADKCLIDQTKRRRVFGNNGPRRNEMKEYGIVDSNVPIEVIQEILNIALSYEGNDLRGDNYQISQHCNVDTVFTNSPTYRQILLQQLHNNATDEIDETNYTSWRNDLKTENIQKYLSETFKVPYRTRISIMNGGNELNYHIDTDTSVLCRVQVPVQTNGSLFYWKTKTDEISLDMQNGCAYFINTGWLHKVVNSSNNTRIVMIFGVDYKNLPEKETLLI